MPVRSRSILNYSREVIPLLAGLTYVIIIGACSHPNHPVEYENWLAVWEASSNYFYTKDSVMISLNDNDVMISTDNGSEWRTVLSGFAYRLGFGQITVGKDNNNVIIANGAVYLSSNEGRDWKLGEYVDSKYVSSDTLGVLYAVSGTRGIIKSSDNGRTWNEAPDAFRDYHPVSISIDGKNRIFVGADGGMYRSTDHGVNWLRVVSGIDSSLLSPAYVVSFGAVTFSKMRFGTYRTDDGGSKWVHISDYDEWPMCMTPDNILVGVTLARYPAYSTDMGKTWNELDRELYAKRLYIKSIGVNGNGFVFIGSVEGKILRSTKPLNRFIY